MSLVDSLCRTSVRCLSVLILYICFVPLGHEAHRSANGVSVI